MYNVFCAYDDSGGVVVLMLLKIGENGGMTVVRWRALRNDCNTKKFEGIGIQSD
jgi:hypothetical protein